MMPGRTVPSQPPGSLEIGAPGTPLATSPASIPCWVIPLDVPECVLEAGLACLDASEVARAGRYHFECHRRRFIARRTARRYLLGKLLEQSPAAVQFREVGSGKPEILAEGGPPVHFSGSHSEETAVLAVSPNFPIGVDVETYRMVEGSLWEVRHLFAEGERTALERISERDRSRMFFDCWTRKEACVKADGAGLEIALDSFEVPVGEMTGSIRVSMGGGRKRSGDVHLLPVPVNQELSVSLAVRARAAHAVELKNWDWSEALRG